MKNNFTLKIAAFSLLAGLVVGPALAFTPNDTQLFQQKYLERVNAFEAWDYLNGYTKTDDVVVAVLDGGVDIEHPDLSENVWVNPGEIAGDGLDNDQNSYIDDFQGWDFVESLPDPRP